MNLSELISAYGDDKVQFQALDTCADRMNMAGASTKITESRAALAALLRDLSADARDRAQKSWRQNKGPMAVYWKAVGAYATHLYRAVRPGAPSKPSGGDHG